MDNNKLNELKIINNKIQNHIRSMVNHGYKSNDVQENTVFYPEIKHHRENNTTSTNIFKIKKGMISKILNDDVFNRIICIKGKIKIYLISFNEEIIITAPNTQLILPKTNYKIEVLEDSEIISVYKTPKKGERFEIKEHETIYNKNITNYE